MFRTMVRIKTILTHAGLVVFSLACALALSEYLLYLRETYLLTDRPAPDDPAMGVVSNSLVRTPAEAFEWHNDGNGLIHVRSENPNLVYELRPNTRLNEYVQTNSFGCRDEEFSVEKPEGVCRIVVLGDSVAFGWDEAPEAVFSEVLEALLNEHAPEGRRFEVCNLSVGGYNAPQELEVLREKVPKLNPDFVILQYCQNDNLMGVDAGLWRHFTRSRLRTWDFLKLSVMNLRERFSTEKMIQRVYREIAGTVHDRGWSFAVLAMPSRKLGNADICAFWKSIGLSYIQPDAAFEACGKDTLFADDYHLATFGHEVTAEELYRRLADTLPCLEQIPEPWRHRDFTEVRKTYLAGLTAQQAGDIPKAEQWYRAAAALEKGYGHLGAVQLTKITRQMLDASKTLEALPLAQTAVELSPKDLMATQAVGLAQYAQGLYTEAAMALQQTVQRAPDSAMLWLELAEARAMAGDFPGALDAYKTYFDLTPAAEVAGKKRYASVFLRLIGEQEQLSRHFDKAMHALDTACAIDPEDLQARETRRDVQEQLAIQTHENAIREWISRGEIALADKRMDDAAEAYANAAALAPDVVSYPLNQGMALMETGRLCEATEPFRKATQLEPAVPDHHACLGLALLACGDSDAWEELDTVDVDNIENPDVAMKLAAAYETSGFAGNAIAAYMRALRIEPLLFSAAEALYKLKAATSSIDEQQVFWGEMSVLLPQSTHVHFFTGIVFLRDRNPDAALSAFERACGLYPENAGAWRFTGETLLLKGQFIRAEEAFREALRLDPAIEGACPGLVRALCGQCQIEQARDVWRSCVVSSES